MNFHTKQQRADFLAAQNRIVRNLTLMHDADHAHVERALADTANALNILQLIWNEVADGQ